MVIYMKISFIFYNNKMSKRKPTPDWQWKDWRPIEWYEWIYDINELWQVRTYRRKGSNGNPSHLESEPVCYKLPLKFYSRWKRAPILEIELRDEFNCYKKFSIWRLVAYHFIWWFKYKDDILIEHRDWDYRNNCVDNLILIEGFKFRKRKRKSWERLEKKLFWN